MEKLPVEIWEQIFLSLTLLETLAFSCASRLTRGIFREVQGMTIKDYMEKQKHCEITIQHGEHLHSVEMNWLNLVVGDLIVMDKHTTDFFQTRFVKCLPYVRCFYRLVKRKEYEDTYPMTTSEKWIKYVFVSLTTAQCVRKRVTIRVIETSFLPLVIYNNFDTPVTYIGLVK